MDDLTIFAGGYEISGWQSIRLTRGIERMPSDFAVVMTERYPGELNKVFLEPGLPVEVKLGTDLVLTGYTDIFAPHVAAARHGISLTGRGKCADLVDCAVIWPGGQIANSNALQIAQKLAAPYGISVKCLSDPGTIIPQDNLILTASPYSVIEEKCRFAALLAYEDVDGNLILSQVGDIRHASGFQEGVNVQEASVAYSAHDRYSEYQVLHNGIDTFSDLGDGGNEIVVVEDPDVKRLRIKRIIADGAEQHGLAGATKRGRWEMLRRAGRSMVVRLVCDSWRDAEGKLWTPNTLATVHLPSLHAADKLWLVSEVSYLRDAQGTRAEVTLMPPEAFEVAPYVIPGPFGDVPPGNSVAAH